MISVHTTVYVSETVPFCKLLSEAKKKFERKIGRCDEKYGYLIPESVGEITIKCGKVDSENYICGFYFDGTIVCDVYYPQLGDSVICTVVGYNERDQAVLQGPYPDRADYLLTLDDSCKCFNLDETLSGRLTNISCITDSLKLTLVIALDKKKKLP
jgi:hypothetical protein